MSKDKVIEFINYYQKSIEKHCDDKARILHCLTKLATLKVNVHHLKETKIGKTVNNVRKFEGEVGQLAKSLVIKWKETVAEAEKAEKLQPPVPLFKLPIKLEPDEVNDALYQPKPDHHTKQCSSSSSSSSDGSRHKSKSEQKSTRNGSSSKDEKKSSKSRSKHHKSHHSASSHSESSSSKRKHVEASTESKENDASHKKIKLESDIKKESPKKVDSNQIRTSAKPKESSSKFSKRKQEVEKVEEEFDGSQGLGFAEALALFDMPSTSKKKDLPMADKITKVSPSKSSKSDKKSSSSSSRSDDTKKSLKALTAPPKLLIRKPNELPLLPDIVNDLPSDVSIPEYRPSPLSSAVKDYINSSVLGSSSSYSCRPPAKQMSDAELLTESFSSKANRTRVFSGNRVQRAVPSLFDMCIRVLQENIEFLECTGGVPFDILRPVLERAKPEQLSNIEYYNSYLMDDSDVLWEPHCKRKFRTRKRLDQEMESWRDMYERCTREDEEKLNRLTMNIKQNQETTSNGVQKTMMAFVDGLAKPPRNVMRKQEIFGTNRKLVVSAAARTEGLKHCAPNLAVAGDARLRVAAGIRDDAQNVVGRGMQQRGIKKAPMMAKILSKFKR